MEGVIDVQDVISVLEEQRGIIIAIRELTDAVRRHFDEFKDALREVFERWI